MLDLVAFVSTNCHHHIIHMDMMPAGEGSAPQHAQTEHPYHSTCISRERPQSEQRTFPAKTFQSEWV